MIECPPGFHRRRNLYAERRIAGAASSGGAYKGSKYGSQASTETVTLGSAPSPHNSRAWKRTV
jgi:hypothetical protein